MSAEALPELHSIFALIITCHPEAWTYGSVYWIRCQLATYNAIASTGFSLAAKRAGPPWRMACQIPAADNEMK